MSYQQKYILRLLLNQRLQGQNQFRTRVADVADLVIDGPDFQPMVKQSQQRQQLRLGRRCLAKPFRPIGLIEDNRHSVVDFGHRCVRRARQHRAA